MISNENTKYALFMDMSHYFFVFLLFLIPIVYVLKIGVSLNFLDYSVFFLGYIFYGGLIEYPVHRFLFHGKNTWVSKFHFAHHENPRARIFTFGWILSDCIWFLYVYVLITLLGMERGLLFSAGSALGLFVFLVMHDVMHLYPKILKHLGLSYLLIEHGLHHHTEGYNYCVSQPFWDRIFGTHYRKPDGTIE